MNLATAQSRFDSSLPRDEDDTAELMNQERLANAVRELDDPIAKLIVQFVERDSIGASGLRNRMPEETNRLLIAAASIYSKRRDDHTSWNEAQGESMVMDSPKVFEVLDLLKSGADNCRLGELVFAMTRKSFAEQCISTAEVSL